MKKINLNKTALIIIHFQNDFCHKFGLCSNGENATEISKKINELIKLFDNSGLVIFSKARYDKKYLSKSQIRPNFSNLDYPCKEKTWGAKYFDLNLPKKFIEIDSSRNDSFCGTSLENILIKNKIKNLLIVGATTEICIASTVMSADSRNFRVFVLKDCVFSPNLKYHKIFLEVFNENFAEVLNFEDLKSKLINQKYISEKDKIK